MNKTKKGGSDSVKLEHQLNANLLTSRVCVMSKYDMGTDHLETKLPICYKGYGKKVNAGGCQGQH